MKKEIPKNGYRVLAIIWTLAAASMAVAVVRQLPEFSVPALLLLAASVVAAASFWKSYHHTMGREDVPGPFDAPPSFRENPELFDDAPPPIGSQLFAEDDNPSAAPDHSQKKQDTEE